MIRAELAGDLRAAGHRVTESPDGAAAIARLTTRVFDVIVSDMSMPRADGRAVLRAAQRESPSTDVILMTSFGEVDDAVLALKAGAYDYLTKPFASEQLLLRL